MKPAILILSILSLISITTFAQSQKRDTISVQSNVLQLEKLSAIEKTINDKRQEYNGILEIIFGVKIEEVEWWGFKQGKFQFILKQKQSSVTYGKKTD